MTNPENLQSFINKETTDSKGIDQTDVKALNSFLFVEGNNLNLKEGVKDVFSQPESLKAMADGINNFLLSPEGTKLLQNPSQHREVLQAYKNILSFLSQLNESRNPAINQIVQNINWKIDNALSHNINTTPQNTESTEVIKKGAIEVINTVTRGLGSTASEILGDEKLSIGAMTMFIEQYNSNNKEQLTYNNLIEQIYKLSSDQKDGLATYLAQIIVSGKAKKEGRNEAQIHANINNYRKSIFPKLFPNDQIAPLLSDQKRTMVGDKSSTDGLVTGISSEAGFGLGAYEYNAEDSKKTTTTVDWLPGQNNLEFSIQTRGVDKEGAEVNLNIGGTTISGTTIGDRQVNGFKANTINRKIPEKLPDGISFQNGSFKLNAAEGNKTPIKVTINSKGGDEVFATVMTNGVVDAIAGDNNLGDQELFANGGRGMSEGGKKSFDKTIGSIHNIIKNRLPNGYKLKIDVGAGTSSTKVPDELHEKLKGDIINLEKTLATTITSKLGKEAGMAYYQDIKQQIDAQIKHETFIDEGNKALAKCRACSTLGTMFANMEPSDLDRISLNVTPLTGNTKRSSQFEMTGIQKIS